MLGGDAQSSNSGRPNFADEDLLQEHFEDHYAEFGYRTKDEYLNRTRNLFKGGDEIESFYRNGDGATLFYNKNVFTHSFIMFCFSPCEYLLSRESQSMSFTAHGYFRVIFPKITIKNLLFPLGEANYAQPGPPRE